MRFVFFLSFCLSLTLATKAQTLSQYEKVEIVILGVAQDAGAPQIACTKSCCSSLWTQQKTFWVSCLGLIDHGNARQYLFDATPDIVQQLAFLSQNSGLPMKQLDGVFITHAHIGHYTGLMHLGREAMGAKEVPVYSMPRMASFLRTNGPWSQLVDLKNISIHEMEDKQSIQLSDSLVIIPMLVPHRGEFSETVGFRIIGPRKSALFIPDIDKWEKWEKSIVEEIKKVDYAFIDATFFRNGEIKGRDMSTIPHPFVEESMRIFEPLSGADKNKIHFIHFNHTNPLLFDDEAIQFVREKGYNLSVRGMRFDL